MALSQAMREKLLSIGFSENALSQIESYSPLMTDLENYSGTFSVSSQGSYTIGRKENAHIFIQPNADMSSMILTLTHELRHAMGSYQANDETTYPNINEYVSAYLLGEGEALYAEYNAAKFFGISAFGNTSAMLKDWVDVNAWNFKPTLDSLIRQYAGKPNFQLCQAIGDQIVRYLIPSTDHPISGEQGFLTYGEQYAWRYISQHSSVIQEYNNTFADGSLNPTLTDTTDRDRYRVKTLANTKNHFFGTAGSDVLINKAGGLL